MRRMLIPILVAAMCAGCGMLPWSDEGTGMACQQDPDPGDAVREGDPLAAGQPLAGLDVRAMTAAAIGTAAVDHDLPVTWRYYYDVGAPFEGGSAGYSECWCVAPPDGHVTQVAYDGMGGLIVFVDSGQRLGASRSQPRLGWGCGDETARVIA
jgi:hypothetical protein